ncbi:MAG: protein kinase [Eubacteriales bacterium]|nr:protein kinase [Eubacteriales bacterium]
MDDIFTIELPDLPKPLSDRFEVISCIKHSGECSVYLLKEIQNRRQVLLKVSSDPVTIRTLENEKQILDAIHADSHSALEASFPKALWLEQFSGAVYYIRTYINGKTLEDLCETNPGEPGLSEDQALDYVIHLAELLHFLHSMTPPVIHRDIKPQNVIVDNDGNCHFIDMGISRFFDRTQSHDTLIMGTKQMAPPEQFGFRQTDKRSDIYSLGVLMYYCVTGEYTITENGLKKLRRPARQIIRKATMFDPDQRYTDAKEMMGELLNARFHPYLGKNRHRNRKRLAIGAAAALLLFAGWLFLHFVSKEKSYSFTEPLIEEAVRMQLDKPQGTVTAADLEQIRELHIFGRQIYDDESEVWLHGSYPWFYDDAVREAGLYRMTGSIRSLEDIRNMPNLDVLCLYQQQITDLSPLKDTEISCLGLGYNPITGLDALADNSAVRSLLIPGVSLADPESLGALSSLEELNISNTNIVSLSFLDDSPIEKLNLFQVSPDDYRELKNAPSLTCLYLDHMDQTVMEQLYGLALTDLTFYYSSDFALSDIQGLTQLEQLTFFGDQGPLCIKEQEISLPALRQLTLSYTTIENFHFLSTLSGLTSLNIYHADCKSYEGLDALPALETIICTQEQEDQILSAYPEFGVLLHR